MAMHETQAEGRSGEAGSMERPGDQPRGGNGGMKGSAADLAEQAKELAAQQISRATDQARQFAAQRFDQTKQWAAEELSHIASALRTGAQKLDETNDAQVSSYANSMADWAEQCACYVRDNGLDDVTETARGLVRNRPEWVLGGLFLAGIALGRFLKASSQPQSAAMSGEGGQGGYSGAENYSEDWAQQRPATYQDQVATI